MRFEPRNILLVTLLGIFGPPSYVDADEILVAVASNFRAPMTKIIQSFQDDTGHTIKVSYGSTGKQYAQILQGAPFQVYLAGDDKHPGLLERQSKTIAGTRRTYAIGQLVFWAPGHQIAETGLKGFSFHTKQKISIANPRLAPYGLAAEFAINKLGVEEAFSPHLVRAENVAQAYQFIRSGAAVAGFVAKSQVLDMTDGSVWHVPQAAYPAIVQQMVLLRDTPAGRSFINWMSTQKARTIILQHGYGASRS